MVSPPASSAHKGGTMRRILLAAAGALLASAGTASAQGLSYKPIDTNAAIVQPTDATTGILTSTVRYVSRADAAPAGDDAAGAEPAAAAGDVPVDAVQELVRPGDADVPGVRADAGEVKLAFVGWAESSSPTSGANA